LGKPEEHTGERFLSQSVYGLPELHADEIANADLLGNVGCFAIGCILAMSPAVKGFLIDPSTLIFDCKTGVSGAGKKVNPSFHFPARQDNMNAYRLTGHQHVCEIERELGGLMGSDLKVTFTAQVVPANRGILAVSYAKLSSAPDYAAVLDAYRSFYADKPFVRIFDRNAAVGTQHVRGTNYCNLVVDVEERTGMLRVISHIDNLMKGQAGNALQNMNLMFGFPETMGLDRPGQYP
jgi:N-acetyl-gamma-glutamyl-phosphate reductase